MVFDIPVLSAIILQQARRSFFKTAATRAIFSFVSVLRSASSMYSSPSANWLCYRNIVACDTGESPNAFTNISHIRSCKSCFTIKFYRSTLFKIFSIVIYNPSTEHTISHNALSSSYRRINFKLGM